MKHDPTLASSPFCAEDLDVGRLLKLLPEVATLDVCSAYLKLKGLHFSAGDWEEMTAKRFAEPIKNDLLKVDDLAGLVHECQEYSSKRIVLYQGRSGAPHPIFDLGKRKPILDGLKDWPTFGKRSIGWDATKPAVIEFREDKGLDGRRCIVIKIGTLQKRETLQREQRAKNGDRVMIFRSHDVPVINVVRLFETGLLEVRMHQDREIESYKGLERSISKLIAPLISTDEFQEREIHGLLTKIWDPVQRKTMSDRLRITMSTHRNGKQTVMEVRTGRPTGDLNSDPDTIASVDRFLEQRGGDATGCRSAYLSVLADKGTKDEERDLRIHVHGSPNEFSVPSKCRKVDYERALTEILNKTSIEAGGS